MIMADTKCPCCTGPVVTVAESIVKAITAPADAPKQTGLQCPACHGSVVLDPTSLTPEGTAKFVANPDQSVVGVLTGGVKPASGPSTLSSVDWNTWLNRITKFGIVVAISVLGRYGYVIKENLDNVAVQTNTVAAQTDTNSQKIDAVAGETKKSAEHIEKLNVALKAPAKGDAPP
jgi:hypothetical protein